MAESPGAEVGPRSVVGARFTGAPDTETIWKVAILAGLALVAVGWVDIAFVWYPPRWANVDWEFGSVSTTFDALPLPTIGLVAVLSGLAGQGRRRWQQLVAVVFVLLALVWVLFALVFALDIPVVMRSVNEQIRGTARHAMMKTSAMAAVYIVLYLTVGVVAFRRARASAKGASR